MIAMHTSHEPAVAEPITSRSTTSEHAIPSSIRARPELGPDLLMRACLSGYGRILFSALRAGRAGAPAEHIVTATRTIRSASATIPGADLARIAICAAANELITSAAPPLCVQVALSAPAGAPFGVIEALAASMRAACDELGAALLADDLDAESAATDAYVIRATALGVAPARRRLRMLPARPGDQLVVSGAVGDHGLALRAPDAGVRSDCTILTDLAREMRDVCPLIRAIRPVGARGLYSAVRALARQVGCEIRPDWAAAPVRPAVRSACEDLLLDPLALASEGRLIALVPADASDAILELLRWHDPARDAAVIGEVTDRSSLSAPRFGAGDVTQVRDKTPQRLAR